MHAPEEPHPNGEGYPITYTPHGKERPDNQRINQSDELKGRSVETRMYTSHTNSAPPRDVGLSRWPLPVPG